MNNKELKQIWEATHRYACKRQYHQLADDFAQEACIALHRGRKASLKQLFIDHLRKEYGSTGTRSSIKHPPNSPGGKAFVSIDDQKRFGDSGKSLHDIIAAPDRDSGVIGSLGRLGLSLNATESTVLELVERSDQKTVGDLLGVTPSRICQIIGKVKKKISNERVVIDFYDTYTDFKEASVLRVDWITI